MKEMAPNEAWALARDISKKLDKVENQAIELLRWAATRNLNTEPFREAVRAITEAYRKTVIMRPETLNDPKGGA